MRRSLLFTLMIAVALLLPTSMLISTAVSAQGSEQAALQRAIDAIAKRLNRTITTIENYTYEVLTFEDTSFGCAPEGETVTPLVFQGYKFIITYRGISYDVRTSLDGTQVVICDGEGIRQSSGLSVYRSSDFTIAYPADWRVVDRGSDVYFGISNTPVCSEPGMIVEPLGTVTSDETSDALIDRYFETLSGLQVFDDRTTIRNVGRTQQYISPCVDGSPRQGRVTVFEVYGRGYRVVQFAPQRAFEQWADVFLEALEQFSPSTLTTGSGEPIVPPSVAPPVAIAHIFAGNVYVGTLVDLPGIPITTNALPGLVYRDAVIAPNGSQVAFVDPNNTLMVAPVTGEQLKRPVIAGLHPSYPITWSPAGDEVAYLSADGSMMMAVNISTGTARQLATIEPFPANCRTIPADPAARLYESQTGKDGNSLLFVWNADRILYSPTCDGIGVAAIADGASTVVNPEIRRVSVSPDGSELLGILDTTLVRMRIADGTVVALSTESAPEQATWSIDGKFVFYASSADKDSVTVEETDADRARATFGTFPVEAVVRDISVRQLDLTTGEDAELVNTEGYGVATITPSPDGSGVLFTVVSSAKPQVEGFRNQVSVGEFRRLAPVVQFYWSQLPFGALQLLAVSGNPHWGPVGSAPEPTPTGGATYAPGAYPTLVQNFGGENATPTPNP
jgi:hypothetical protein